MGKRAVSEKKKQVISLYCLQQQLCAHIMLGVWDLPMDLYAKEPPRHSAESYLGQDMAPQYLHSFEFSYMHVKTWKPENIGSR
jgi:hypothetical protein